MRDPFIDVAAALRNDSDGTDPANGPIVRIDSDRARRTGIPEVVLAAHKRPDDLAASISRLLDANGRVLVSRLRDDQWDTLDRFAGEGVAIERADVKPTGGRIAVISAGSSDRPVAEEAALMAREMGVEVTRVTDVGVAGLHRLVQPLREIVARDVDCIIVAAGMDGALPSVVAGLVEAPVIGLPVNVGYGHGGGGEAALMSMLQSCAPGITVVNIDNGIGAGSTAALIANRMATARRRD